MKKFYKSIILGLFCIILTLSDNHARYIYFLWHCETDWNKVEKLQSISNTRLNENSRLQTEEIGRRLSNEKYNIKLIYTSPLLRSRQTANIIGG